VRSAYRQAVCRICGAGITVHQRVRGGVCERASCKRTALHRDMARRREEAAAAKQRVEAFGRQLIAAGPGPADVEAVAVALVPSNDQPVTRLPAGRRRAFREFLEQLIAETAPGPEPADPDAVPPSELLALGCATCRGHCCRSGGTHAYLDEAIIRRYAAQHPEMTAPDIVEAYVERLPARSFQDSCVYHGLRGCVLPREMRAAICNWFQCDGLKSLAERLEQAAPQQVVAVAGSDGRYLRATIAGADGVHRRWRA
jgi:hypothetical protein